MGWGELSYPVLEHSRVMELDVDVVPSVLQLMRLIDSGAPEEDKTRLVSANNPSSSLPRNRGYPSHQFLYPSHPNPSDLQVASIFDRLQRAVGQVEASEALTKTPDEIAAELRHLQATLAQQR